MSQGVAIEVIPSSATLAAAATQPFTSAVTGTLNTLVTWTVSEGSAGGTVSSSGTYTAPATLGSYHVVATSVADPTKSAVATVSVTNTPPSGTGTATLAGAVTAPYPTIRNIALHWAFTGDSNANGSVGVRYRRVGDSAWHTGMPLRRVPGRTNEGFTWANRHAGSLFDLEQGTTYEIELSLADPDGGSTVRTLTATTRTYPAPMPGAPVRSATPSTLGTVLSSTQPGDIVELAAGTYGAFTVSRNGAAGQPVVIRAAAGGGVTVNGRITLTGRSHVHVQGLTVTGDIRANGTSSVAIVGNVLNTTADGIVFATRSQNNYVADNVVTGATGWAGSSFGVDGNNIGEGIELTGPGHVIEHNRVRGFRDCISLMEDGEAVDQYSIDVVENDLSICADDAIEGDFCFHNCRFVRNRVTNAFMGLSSQPSLGGPTYFIRNAMYNVVLNTFKLNRGSDGDVLLQNTVVKNGDAHSVYSGVANYRQYARNNLFIGGPGGTYGGYSNGSGRVIQLADADAATQDLDYDAYGTTASSFSGRIGSVTFSSLSELRSRTTEAHATQVGLSVFAGAVGYPSSPMSEYAVRTCASGRRPRRWTRGRRSRTSRTASPGRRRTAARTRRALPFPCTARARAASRRLSRPAAAARGIRTNGRSRSYGGSNLTRWLRATRRHVLLGPAPPACRVDVRHAP
jgi:hypothetical protein